MDRFRLVLVLPAAVLMAAAPAPQAIDLPGDHLHPESVSITPDGTAYVGSMFGGVIKVALSTGKVTPWLAPGAYGSGALYGVLADRRHGLLWTCTNDFPGTALSVAGADPGHWLKGFDLATGKGRVSLKLPGEKPVCNDIAVGGDGSVYVTDTGQPRILRWRPGVTELEVWLEDPVFNPPGKVGGLDGIALGGDGALYVNNVRSGALYRVTIGAAGKPGKVTPLSLSRPLASPDGMRPLGGLDFLLAEGKGTISRFTVTGDHAEITTLATGINQPTGVDTALGSGWYVQGQLSAIFRPGTMPELPFRLTPVALKP
jgi:sugar lactone lactonase YvrE